MKKLIVLLITLGCIVPGYSFAATHNIHIEWTYDLQPVEGRTLAGYYLYKEGTKICTSNNSTDRAMDCDFESANGTFNFTLTAFSTDGTESPHSIPYTFTVTTTSEPELTAAFGTTPTSLSGDVPFTVSFNASASTGNIASYSWHFGDNNLGSGLQTSHTYTTAGTFNATLTVTSANGTTNQKSVTVTTTAPPAAPVAIITPETFSGDAPLTVSFDGSSSTSAVSYAWNFGDGATANSSQTNHTFTSAGTFTTTLTVTNALGQTHSTITTVTVNEVVAENTPPSAVISSSTAIGEAPLSISFDGSGSYDTEGPISSYLWNFGDGSQPTTEARVTYKYTVAGTYSASLTVTDNQGATNTTSTPVIITGQTEENLAPTARLTTSVTEGAIPLEVTFDGSTSTDPEDSPLTYNWNFGDGASGQGVTSTHIYTSPGSFTATLTVTDDIGATSSTTTTINAEEETTELQIELGEVEIDHNWMRVEFSDPFINPVVLAGPPSYSDNNPCVVRVKNITSTGFDIRIQEWNYLDGSHTKETVAYLVIEEGDFTLEDGTRIEAGQFASTNDKFQTVQFNTAFAVEPVVMTSIATFNEEDTVTGRLRNISLTSFEHKTQEQESLKAHGNETINYIAWEPSQNTIGDINIIVNKTADEVRHSWHTINYGQQPLELPLFFATMQSQDGRDTSAIRYTNKTNNAIQVKVEEEQSKNTEIRHTTESVGYFLFSSSRANEPVNQAPVAISTSDTVMGDTPLTVNFDASSSFDEDGSIVTYLWNFGDNNTETGIVSSHTFITAGSYSVILTVEDDKGQIDEETITINVTAAQLAETEIIGNDVQFTGGRHIMHNTIVAYKLPTTPSQDGILESISFTLAFTGKHAKFALYTHDETNDLPGEIVPGASTVEGTTTTDAYNLVTLEIADEVKPVIEAGTQYWIVLESTDDWLAFGASWDANSKIAYKNNDSYNWDPWGGSALETKSYKIGACYFAYTPQD